MSASDGGDTHLARAFRVLEAFDSELTALTVGAIAAATSIPLASAYRIVGDLVGMGLLLRDVDGRIRLGSRLWELANRGSPLSGLREAARPELIALHREFGSHVNLAVLREGSVLVVDRIVADSRLPNRSVTAARMSALRSSLGLALLAHAPAAQLRLAVAIELASRADDPDGAGAAAALEAETGRVLARARRAHFAVQRGLQDATTLGIAAPVRRGARGGEGVAAVGVVLPIETTATAERAVGERLHGAARRIAQRLDHLDAERRPADSAPA